MNERDRRIILLREVGLSYSWIGRCVGISKVRVGQIIRKHRFDLAGPSPYHRVLTSREVDQVLELRARGYSKEMLSRITGCSWKTQQRIYNAYPERCRDLKVERDQLIIDLRRHGIKQVEIAKRAGCARSTVTRVIAELAPELITRRLSPVAEIMSRHDQGMTGAAISRELKMKPGTVCAVIRRE
jgi:DNA-directed RNA polymerase specialized sigma subunit